jgi:hypothetical protein
MIDEDPRTTAEIVAANRAKRLELERWADFEAVMDSVELRLAQRDWRRRRQPTIERPAAPVLPFKPRPA